MLTDKTFDIAAYKEQLFKYLPILQKHKVGILDGPVSAEDRLYIEHGNPLDRSVTAVKASLDRLGISYNLIDPTVKGWFDKVKDCNPFVITIHGEYGEDGRIQGLLDMLGKHYVGSSVAASAIGLSKPLFKSVISGFGFQTPPFSWSGWAVTDLVESIHSISFPVMAKPLAGGSSVGMTKIDSYADYQAFINKNGDKNHFFEQYVNGRIITVGLMDTGNDFLVFSPLEVVPTSEFYDEETKLKSEHAPQYTFPEDLLKNNGGRIQKTAYDIFTCVGGANYGRVDFLLDSSQNLWALEINTLPGLSRHGNFTLSAQHVGFSYDEMIISLLKSSLATEHSPVPNPIAEPLQPKRKRKQSAPSQENG